MVFIHAPVGQDQNSRPVPVGLIHLHEQLLDGPFQSGALIVGDGENRRFQAAALQLLQFQHIRVAQNRLADL